MKIQRFISRIAQIAMLCFLVLVALVTVVLWTGSAIAFIYNGVPGGWMGSDYVRTVVYLLIGTAPVVVGVVRYSRSGGTASRRLKCNKSYCVDLLASIGLVLRALTNSDHGLTFGSFTRVTVDHNH